MAAKDPPGPRGRPAVDATELRHLQRPLKQGYRDDPASALIPARAVGRLDVPTLTVTFDPRSGAAGLHRAAGGTGEHTCSADMLLEALVACAGVTLAAVATAMAVPIRGAVVVAEGRWDARGTLGVDRDVPVGLTDLSLRFELDTDADEATVDRLVTLAERYCVIAQTLAHPPAVAFSHTVSVAG